MLMLNCLDSPSDMHLHEEVRGLSLVHIATTEKTKVSVEVIKVPKYNPIPFDWFSGNTLSFSIGWLYIMTMTRSSQSKLCKL
jgi:hypothetical protein